ncbi:hypothetical protein [Streptosporangium sp. NPDC002607]
MGVKRTAAPPQGADVRRPAVVPSPRTAAHAVPDGRAATPAAPRPDTVTAGRARNPAKPLPDRQIRKIVLQKAARALVYHLGDGTTHTSRVRWYCDFPPGTYVAKPQPGSTARWFCPEVLQRYLAESAPPGAANGRRYSVVIEPADHRANPGTFEGVPDFVFEVVGERVAADLPGDTSYPGVREALDSPEMRRYLSMRGRDDRRPPARERPDADAFSPDESSEMARIQEQLAQLTETDWELLEVQAASAPPAGSWADARKALDRYMRSSVRTTALMNAADRDARIVAAESAIDPGRQAHALARLEGTGDLYDAIAAYKAAPDGSLANSEWKGWYRERKARLKQEMMRHLEAQNFKSVAEFDTAVRELRLAVRRQATLLALTDLKEGERILKAELQRYRSKDTLNSLLTALRKLTDPNEPGGEDAIKRVLTDYPLLRDPVVFKGAIEAKYPEFLGDLLRQNAEAQLGNVTKSREALRDDSDLVFKFDIVIDQTLGKLGLSKTSPQARLIRDAYGVKRSAARAIFDMVLLVLCIAAGPLGWIGYLANLTAFVVQIADLRDRERGRQQLRGAAHAGKPLATPPSDNGSLLEALGLLLAGVSVLHLPAPRGSALVVRESTALVRLDLGPQVRTVAPGVVEIVLPGQPGVLRVTQRGLEGFAEAGAAQPVLSRPWVSTTFPTPRADLLAQAPQLATIRAAAEVSMGGRPVMVGVTADGWFVYAPGTRTPLQTGFLGPAAPSGRTATPALPPATPAPPTPSAAASTTSTALVLSSKRPMPPPPASGTTTFAPPRPALPAPAAPVPIPQPTVPAPAGPRLSDLRPGLLTKPQQPVGPAVPSHSTPMADAPTDKAAQAVVRINELLAPVRKRASAAAAQARTLPQKAEDQAKQALDRARAAEPAISAEMQAIAEELKATLSGFPQYVLKGPGRYREKLASLIERFPDRTPDDLVRKISDAIRYTLTFSEDRYVMGIAEATAALQRRGFHRVYQRATWSDPRAYKGVNTGWRAPDGHRFELQFHTQGSLSAKEATHEVYEYDKYLEAADRITLREAVGDAFEGVLLPPGAKQIPTLEGND